MTRLFGFDLGAEICWKSRTVDVTRLIGKNTQVVTRTEPRAPKTDATENKTFVKTTETGGTRSTKGEKGKVLAITRRSFSIFAHVCWSDVKKDPFVNNLTPKKRKKGWRSR